MILVWDHHRAARAVPNDGIKFMNDWVPRLDGLIGVSVEQRITTRIEELVPLLALVIVGTGFGVVHRPAFSTAISLQRTLGCGVSPPPALPAAALQIHERKLVRVRFETATVDRPVVVAADVTVEVRRGTRQRHNRSMMATLRVTSLRRWWGRSSAAAADRKHRLPVSPSTAALRGGSLFSSPLAISLPGAFSTRIISAAAIQIPSPIPPRAILVSVHAP